eukprot:scaffold321_cov95-Cylindrotheca_fusiformis.AAC.3
MIRCFANSNENKLRRKEEEALSLAVRSGKLKASVLIDQNEEYLSCSSIKRKMSSQAHRPQQQQQQQQQRPGTPPTKEEPKPANAPAERQRTEPEKFLSIHGDVMLKKEIVRPERARSCATCKFRDWSKGDYCYLLAKKMKKQAKDDDDDKEQDEQPKQLYLWMCPDCARLNGMPEKYYHRNRNILPPVPDPVIDITMHRELSPVDPEDVGWVTKAQQRPKPMNWDSQYAKYYSDIVMEQERQQYVCAPISQDPDNPESYIEAITACSERTKKGTLHPAAFYVPAPENDSIAETCSMYLGDL